MREYEIDYMIEWDHDGFVARADDGDGGCPSHGYGDTPLAALCFAIAHPYLMEDPE